MFLNIQSGVLTALFDCTWPHAYIFLSNHYPPPFHSQKTSRNFSCKNNNKNIFIVRMYCIFWKLLHKYITVQNHQCVQTNMQLVLKKHTKKHAVNQLLIGSLHLVKRTWSLQHDETLVIKKWMHILKLLTYICKPYI